MTLFYSYSTSATNILRYAFYYHKFNVNMWTLCFVLQKVPKSFKAYTNFSAIVSMKYYLPLSSPMIMAPWPNFIF